MPTCPKRLHQSIAQVSLETDHFRPCLPLIHASQIAYQSSFMLRRPLRRFLQIKLPMDAYVSETFTPKLYTSFHRNGSLQALFALSLIFTNLILIKFHVEENSKKTFANQIAHECLHVLNVYTKALHIFHMNKTHQAFLSLIHASKTSY